MSFAVWSIKGKICQIMNAFHAIWMQAFVFIRRQIIFRVMYFIPAGIVSKRCWRGRHRANTHRHSLTLILTHLTCMCLDCGKEQIYLIRGKHEQPENLGSLQVRFLYFSFELQSKIFIIIFICKNPSIKPRHVIEYVWKIHILIPRSSKQ